MKFGFIKKESSADAELFHADFFIKAFRKTASYKKSDISGRRVRGRFPSSNVVRIIRFSSILTVIFLFYTIFAAASMQWFGFHADFAKPPIDKCSDL